METIQLITIVILLVVIVILAKQLKNREKQIAGLELEAEFLTAANREARDRLTKMVIAVKTTLEQVRQIKDDIQP